MVLQYKGFNHNWCYEEANIITYAIVGFDPVVKASMQRKFDKQIEESPQHCSAEDYEMQKIVFWHEEIETMIKEDTHCSEEIDWRIGDTPLQEVQNFLVVMLSGDSRQDKDITYVFNKADCGVYLLNDSGKTVQKL